MRDLIFIEVSESSSVGQVRRVAARTGERLGLDADAIARASLVITELATNLVKHASGGIMLIGRDDATGQALEILALDSGNGIANVPEALSDGHSTAGTAGTGLGAVSRHADLFQLYTRKGHGTAVLARFGHGGQRSGSAASVGGLSVPIRGEDVSGDGWCSNGSSGGHDFMVVDGLGHGLQAHEAAVAACKAFETSSGSTTERMNILHDALRGTRGAAVAIAHTDTSAGVLRFCGVGNISATIVDPQARRSAVSMHGIVGHQMREAREFTYPWTHRSSLIMHSDGLTTKWNLDAYPALLTRDPVLTAAVLWKDHRRQNDDSTVVVACAQP